ncbi:adenine nucleotide alpha hydrolases-like protein [Zymoseptoria brevis]|uniref:Adenine nucleotide alpha hydrolases-like protein n=1 Tax=Zymoseptoria brevis TaxID=1047168 RepID=A0A0F4GTL8_9PEZI|nr:adenine nucleotide alpha hydrolases-like protein [Zymoseptoria brevis]
MADEPEPPVRIVVDEEAAKNTPVAPSTANAQTTTAHGAHPSSSSLSPPATPPASPPVSPPADGQSAAEDYYSPRPRFDRLGNALPDRRRPSAMASVYGTSKIRLPGDLGANDPRRPKSPAPGADAQRRPKSPAQGPLPGDLGAKDPRRPKSPAPSGTGSVPNSPTSTSHHQRHASGASIGSDYGGARLQEDPPEPDQPDSDSDADADNDNDTDGDDSQRGRGRKRPEPGRTTSGKATNVREDSEDSERDVQFASGAKPDPTKGESKLSFLEDQKMKAMREGWRAKRRVHPSTAFDSAPSGATTPLHSDDESQIELRAAQRLTLTMSAVHSTPSAHRVIRQIIRGDFEHFQQEAEDGRKRQRMYLVATDMSPEAEYALEWTIGTVLRDGDTLFAVYAADEESVGVHGEGGVEIGHGADSVKDTAAIVKGLPAVNHAPSALSPLSKTSLSGSGADGRSRSRGVYSSAETERRKALEGVTERCVRLLRKTRLQVRVVVEVFHCKSPRHMITEVIDFLSPTLVIIGSRGRSAVKGVLLGSFSNYLVTKSSVPVMVARKKLRKHSTAKRNKDGLAVPYQGSGRAGRFSNIIEAPKLGLRVQSWDQVGID